MISICDQEWGLLAEDERVHDPNSPFQSVLNSKPRRKKSMERRRENVQAENSVLAKVDRDLMKRAVKVTDDKGRPYYIFKR